MKKMKIGNWEFEVSKWWLFDSQNWLFRLTPAISFGYMPGYVTLEAKWLFGELSLILSNSDKLKEYFDRVSRCSVDEDESCCGECCLGDCKGCGCKEEKIERFPETVEEVKQLEEKQKVFKFNVTIQTLNDDADKVLDEIVDLCEQKGWWFSGRLSDVTELESKEPILVDGFPRRNRVDLYVPAEIAIQNAVQEVEKAGAHPLLTQAVISLQEAKDFVADYIELGKEDVK